ncbi:MAG: MFS transporter [Culicoidibacterales bacterium]
MNAKAKFILGMQFVLLALYNLAHPVTPQLLEAINAPVYVFGVLLAIMSLMQLFFAPFWGRVSDRFGRRIMFLGPLGYACAQLLFAFAITPGQLFIARAVAGIFAVITFTVNMAYLADQTLPQQRGRAMTLLAMMSSLGTSLGYFIGGQLGVIGYQIPFFVQFGGGIVIAIIILMMTKQESGSGEVKSQAKSSQTWRMLLTPTYRATLLPLLAITFFGVLAYVAYNGTIPYYLTQQYAADSASVGNFVSFINLAAVGVNFGLLPILKRYVKEVQALIGALVLSFVVMIGILLPTQLGIFFVLGAVFVAGYTLMLAMTQTLISNQATAADQGVILGLRQSFQASGQVVGSLAAGMLFSIHLYLPFVLTLVALGIAIIISIGAKKTERSIR